MVSNTETSIGWFFWITLNKPFVAQGEGQNIKCKAYFAKFGQSECVYFTIDESYNKHNLYKNMVPMSYKYVSVYIKYLHYIYFV